MIDACHCYTGCSTVVIVNENYYKCLLIKKYLNKMEKQIK